ncbi:MAG: hypothetical protein M1539_05900 [Actinobacteria bacterium]|nr:hypothetical protein [Actinomycetota bacterium]
MATSWAVDVRRAPLIILTLLLMAIVIAGGWFGLGWVEARRADMLLREANGHIETADNIMAQMKLDRLGRENFTSLENINEAAAALQDMKLLLGQAAGPVNDAEDEMSAAAGLPLIDDNYRAYLEKKRDTAAVRRQQLDTLAATVDRLDQLYGVGPAIFNSVQEMDRLLGQLEDSMGKVQSSPQEAAASLRQTAASFLQVQKQLDQSYSQEGFPLLTGLSKTAADDADLATLGARLADAAGAGDQAAAQQAAVQIESRLMTISTSGDPIDPWWQEQIEPLQRQYSDLQSQLATLDAEAASLYEAMS